MHATYCSLVVALGHLPDDPMLEEARWHLQEAIALARKYQEIYFSIQWNESPLSVKRCIRLRCSSIAFDCYSHMVEIPYFLDKFANVQTELGISQPSSWRKLIFDLECAFICIEEQHHHRIYCKQLSLEFSINL